MKAWGVALLGAGMMVSGQAAAGVVLGGSGLHASRSYENVDDSWGRKLYLGYRPDRDPWMLELSFVDTGDADIESMPGAALSFSGWQATVGWLNQDRPSGSGIWAKGGFYSGDSEVAGTAEQSASGLTLGVGGVLKLAPWVGFRGEIESLVGVNDFSEDENVTLISLGLEFEFGGGSSAAVEPPPPPAERPQTYLVPPAPAAAPPAATPQPPPVAVAANDRLGPGPARVQVEAPLRTRPQTSAAVQQMMPAGSVLQLNVRQENAEGAWWFVGFQGRQGWVREAEVGR